MIKDYNTKREVFDKPTLYRKCDIKKLGNDSWFIYIPKKARKSLGLARHRSVDFRVIIVNKHKMNCEVEKNG